MFFFRFRQLLRITGNSIVENLVKNPLLTAGILSTTAYMIYLRYLPLLISIAVVLPVLVITILLLHLFLKILKRRILHYTDSSAAGKSPYPEIALFTVIILLIFIIESNYLNVWIAAVMISFYLWAVWAGLTGRYGWFFTIGTGIMLLPGVLASYTALRFTESIYIEKVYLSQYSEKELPLKITWENSPGHKFIINNNKIILSEFILPESMHFQPPLQAKDDIGYSEGQGTATDSPNAAEVIPYPVAGQEVFRLTSDPYALDMPPLMIVYRLRQNSSVKPEESIIAMQTFLGYLRNRTGIENIQYKGTDSILPPLSQHDFNSVYWTYTLPAAEKRNQPAVIYRLTYSVTVTVSGTAFAVITLEPETPGFPYSKDFRKIFADLKFK
jgi:hypothetical protein